MLKSGKAIDPNGFNVKLTLPFRATESGSLLLPCNILPLLLKTSYLIFKTSFFHFSFPERAEVNSILSLFFFFFSFGIIPIAFTYSRIKTSWNWRILTTLMFSNVYSHGNNCYIFSWQFHSIHWVIIWICPACTLNSLFSERNYILGKLILEGIACGI